MSENFVLKNWETTSLLAYYFAVSEKHLYVSYNKLLYA